MGPFLDFTTGKCFLSSINTCSCMLHISSCVTKESLLNQLYTKWYSQTRRAVNKAPGSPPPSSFSPLKIFITVKLIHLLTFGLPPTSQIIPLHINLCVACLFCANNYDIIHVVCSILEAQICCLPIGYLICQNKCKNNKRSIYVTLGGKS